MAKINYLDNIVLAGDLYPPCINLTDVYGIFDKNKLVSFFTVFKGFTYPSVVPLKSHPEVEKFILSNINQILSNDFTLVSFTLKESQLQNIFTITDRSAENCMIVDRSRFKSHEFSSSFKRVTKKDFNRIDEFYKLNQTYPWNLIQLESQFYFFFENENRIIACGGTHFETPDIAHLGNIMVLPEFRRQSIGIGLVSLITNEILKSKKFVTLFVTQDNLPAINLYKKVGFSQYNPVSIFSCRV